jgi:hypothetical protein
MQSFGGAFDLVGIRQDCFQGSILQNSVSA